MFPLFRLPADMSIRSYAKLIRLQNQIGTLLLFTPCLIGLLFCKDKSISNIFLFLISAFVARSCGCILNDIADSKIDKNTLTTSHRPIASGQITNKQAFIFFFTLLSIGLPLLYFYSTSILIPLFITGIFVLIYPYSKRFFPIPQLILGLVYSSGFLLAIVNHFEIPLTHLHPKVWIFYFGLVLWVVIFDTIYAKRDYPFDIANNVKSSTTFFAKHLKSCIAIILILVTLFTIGLYTYFLLFIIVPFFISTVYNMQKQKEEAYRKINFVLIYLVLFSNILLSISALTPTHYALLGVNSTIQFISIFLRPSLGFKANSLCIISLSLIFLM